MPVNQGFFEIINHFKIKLNTICKNIGFFGKMQAAFYEVIHMSFVKNDNQQLTVLDSTFNLTEREKRMLEKSWANTFADKVFPAIDENIFSVLYSKKASRPNTPVNVIVGALILKEALNVTDDEIVEAMAFDIRYQYALHTTSFEEQPISDRTLSRFRARGNRA